MHVFWLLIFLSLVLLFKPAAADVVGVSSVIDADTLEIHGERIRLHGIDAPESAQLCEDKMGNKWRCGQKAAFALADKIGKRTVTCVGDKRDRYDRLIAICYLKNEDLNGWLVRNGWAVAYRRYSEDYVEAEQAARKEGAGIWSGKFQMPWEWRKSKRK